MAIPAGKRSPVCAVLLGLLLLAGCAGDGDKLFTRAVAPPPPAQVEAGSTFTLTAPVTIPPDAGALYFQDNQIVELVSLARDMPYCALSPASPASPGRLEPRTFAVRSVEYEDRRSNVTGQASDVTRIACRRSRAALHDELSVAARGAVAELSHVRGDHRGGRRLLHVGPETVDDLKKDYP